MATDHKASGPLSDSEHRRQLRRALIASTVGTTIEWYDFLLYSTVTGRVFAKLFSEAARQELAAEIGADGQHLLNTIDSATEQPVLAQLPAAQVLRQVWAAQYVSSPACAWVARRSYGRPPTNRT